MPQRGARGFRPDRLRARRLKLGLTQAELAKQIRQAHALINAYEGGTVAPGAAALRKLALALDVKPTWLAPLPRKPVLADYRDRVGLTQTGIAGVIGTTAPVVSHTERGISFPSDIERWAAAYGINRLEWIKAWTNGRAEFFASRIPPLDP